MCRDINILQFPEHKLKARDRCGGANGPHAKRFDIYPGFHMENRSAKYEEIS